MEDTKFNFSDSMKQIDEINEWFQRENLDLEEALIKLRQGKELIQKCKERLNGIENEFKELKKDFAEDDVEEIQESSQEIDSSPENTEEMEDVSEDILF